MDSGRMPHRAEVLSVEIVALAIFGPARSGKAKSRLITAEEAKKIAKKLTG